MSLKIKAKIIEISYNRDNNLFKLLLKDLDSNKEILFAIKGTDWGVTSNISDSVISNFCKLMIGKEKNIQIETEQSSLKNAEKNDKGMISQDDINRIHDNLENYPINEVMNIITEEEQNEN